MEGVLLKPLGAVAAVLAIGSIVRLIGLRRSDRATVRRKLGSTAVWWVLLGLLTLVVELGHLGAAILVTTLALAALREYAPWVARRPADRVALAMATGLIVLQGVVVLGPHPRAADWLIPVAGLAFIGSYQAWAGETERFLRATAGIMWGLLWFGYALGHVMRFWDLPTSILGRHGAMGWFLYVFILTQANDIFQALIGRRFGKHAITPVVSPHKTWEGFVGGFVLTSGISMLLAPALTVLGEGAPSSPPWPGGAAVYWMSAGLGALVAVSGFAGDIVWSAAKRDVGVKDSGHLLPGQGGIIDRIDSLTMTGMVLYWVLRLAGEGM